jgi:dipeptidyl aminopeptidase/acylaminoacyl peptidase
LAEEVVAAIDALVVKGTIDPKRVGLMGQSFGGYSTAAILTKRSDRFKAGVAMAGIYDWIFSYGMLPLDKILTDDGNIYSLEMKSIENGQAQLKKPFWLARDAYIRNSPIFDVQDIDTPLMFLHGDLDAGSTGLPGAERMYNAMLRAGKRTTLVRYWGQGHVAQSASAIRDQWYRITTWFDHYLKNASDSVH